MPSGLLLFGLLLAKHQQLSHWNNAAELQAAMAINDIPNNELQSEQMELPREVNDMRYDRGLRRLLLA